MRILHIVGAYCTVHFPLNEDNLCTVSIRGQEPRLATIEDVTERFNSIPWVNGAGGILHSYIFDSETREINYIE
jgi:hypothetical protein